MTFKVNEFKVHYPTRLSEAQPKMGLQNALVFNDFVKPLI